MNRSNQCGRGSDQGFTLVEMLIATVVVLVGLVAVAQLVPMSVMMDSNNRNDGTAMVFAQQQMEALREQPLTNTTFTDPTGVTCPSSFSPCSLGDPMQPGVLVGSPVVVNANSGLPMIDFSVSQETGYGFTYIDPNDPTGSMYDVRWAVATVTNPARNNIVTGKRFMVGVFRRGMQTPTLPVTLDSMVER